MAHRLIDVVIVSDLYGRVLIPLVEEKASGKDILPHLLSATSKLHQAEVLLKNSERLNKNLSLNIVKFSFFVNEITHRKHFRVTAEDKATIQAIYDIYIKARKEPVMRNSDSTYIIDPDIVEAIERINDELVEGKIQ